jgi:non-ribosomal peptide synthetase component F
MAQNLSADLEKESVADHSSLVSLLRQRADQQSDSAVYTLLLDGVEEGRTPREIALAFEDQKLTFDELNGRANKLAHWLKKHGVGPDVLVALLMERSVEMVVGLLGILKAGGAYLPLDPHYPQQRLSFMLQDAQPKIILTRQRFADHASFFEFKAMAPDADWQLLAGESGKNPETSAGADSLAYVIYTSGSTGKPKGAMNKHRAITNRLCWMQAAYATSPPKSFPCRAERRFSLSVLAFE